MATIKIELPADAAATDSDYKIESEETAKSFLREFEVLIKKFGSPQAEEKARGEIRLSGKLQKAHDYLDSLKDREKSREAAQIADRMRKSWIREYD